MKLALPAFLLFENNSNGIFQALTILLATLIIVKYSTLFEEEYARNLIDLYVYPFWRIMIIFLVLSSSLWCHRIGLVVALIVFFYLSDMNTLITPLPNL
jgi:hypothetical protein